MSLETQLEMGSAREHELKKSLEKMKESQDAYSSLNEVSTLFISSIHTQRS